MQLIINSQLFMNYISVDLVCLSLFSEEKEIRRVRKIAAVPKVLPLHTASILTRTVEQSISTQSVRGRCSGFHVLKLAQPSNDHRRKGEWSVSRNPPSRIGTFSQLLRIAQIFHIDLAKPPIRQRFMTPRDVPSFRLFFE